MSRLPRSLILGLCLALVGCTTGLPGPSAGEPIRIGAVFPLSGSAARLAGYELRGVQIAVDLVNADGGIGGAKPRTQPRQPVRPPSTTSCWLVM